MLETIQSMLPVSLAYAIPLLPIFLYFWWLQSRNNRMLDKMSQVETETVACRAAQKLLSDAAISDIGIERSDDYSQNEYLPQERKILLGPDTFDQKDLTAIGLATRAAGRAILEKESPDLIRLLDVIKRSTLVFFWFVFTVMAFGLMGNNIPTVIAGYALFGVMLLGVFVGFRLEMSINRRVLNELDDGPLSPDEMDNLRRVLKAEALKF